MSRGEIPVRRTRRKPDVDTKKEVRDQETKKNLKNK